MMIVRRVLPRLPPGSAPRAVCSFVMLSSVRKKLREPIARAFKEKYGLELLEGYGCTEMSPAVAINDTDSPGTGQKKLEG